MSKRSFEVITSINVLENLTWDGNGQKSKNCSLDQCFLYEKSKKSLYKPIFSYMVYTYNVWNVQKSPILFCNGLKNVGIGEKNNTGLNPALLNLEVWAVGSQSSDEPPRAHVWSIVRTLFESSNLLKITFKILYIG